MEHGKEERKGRELNGKEEKKGDRKINREGHNKAKKKKISKPSF